MCAMSLAVKFAIALMGLIAAIVSFRTQLLGLYGQDAPDPVEYTPPAYEECVYEGGYDAC